MVHLLFSDNYKGKVYGIYSIIPEINDKKVNLNLLNRQTMEDNCSGNRRPDRKVCLYLHSELNGQITWMTIN